MAIDEIQRIPDLLSYIQVVVDEDPRPGRFVLTGSQNLLLMESVSQTLAGRSALLLPLPFSLPELFERDLFDPARLPEATVAVPDLRAFENFVRLAAAITAMELNLSRLAGDVGVGQQTARRWLGKVIEGMKLNDGNKVIENSRTAA